MNGVGEGDGRRKLLRERLLFHDKSWRDDKIGPGGEGHRMTQ